MHKKLRWIVLAAAYTGLLVALHRWARGFLVDDAFIVFRYVEHFAAGHGWVYNPGERVEGYSCPAWTFLLGGLQRLGWSAAHAGQWLGWLAGGCAATLTALFVVRRLRLPFALGAASGAIVVTSWPLVFWSGAGLETTMFAALLALCALLCTRQRPLSGLHSVFCLLTAWSLSATRPEGGLFACTILLLAAWKHHREGGSLAHIMGAAAAFTMGILGALLARFLYYGDLLPNTFYAKVGGGLSAISRGFAYWAGFMTRGWGLLLCLLALVGITAIRHTKRSEPKADDPTTPQDAEKPDTQQEADAPVGSKEANTETAPKELKTPAASEESNTSTTQEAEDTPQESSASQETDLPDTPEEVDLSTAPKEAAHTSPQDGSKTAQPSWQTSPLLGVAGLLAAGVFFILVVGGDGLYSYRFVAHLLPILAILAAQGCNLLSPNKPALGLALLLVTAFAGAVPLGAGTALIPGIPNKVMRFSEQRWEQAGRHIARVLPKDTTLATNVAGKLPYYARLRTLDLLGLTDRAIARTPVRSMGRGYAGHEKANPAVVLRKKPDIIYISVIDPSPPGLLVRPALLARHLSKTPLRGYAPMLRDKNFQAAYAPGFLRFGRQFIMLLVRRTYAKRLGKQHPHLRTFPWVHK